MITKFLLAWNVKKFYLDRCFATYWTASSSKFPSPKSSFIQGGVSSTPKTVPSRKLRVKSFKNKQILPVVIFFWCSRRLTRENLFPPPFAAGATTTTTKTTTTTTTTATTATPTTTTKTAVAAEVPTYVGLPLRWRLHRKIAPQVFCERYEIKCNKLAT